MSLTNHNVSFNNVTGSIKSASRQVDNEFPRAVCISSRSQLGDSGCIDSIYITASGSIIILTTNSSDPTASDSCVDACIGAMREIDFDTLESYAMDFTYNNSGQAMRIIDLFASLGYASFSDASKLEEIITRNISDLSFIAVVLNILSGDVKVYRTLSGNIVTIV